MNVFVYGCCGLWHNTEHQSESVVPLFRIHRIRKTRAWVYVYICEYTHTNTRSHLNAQVCMHAHLHGRYYRWIASTHRDTPTHICMCARTHVCTHIYMAGTIAESQANVLTHWHTDTHVCVCTHVYMAGTIAGSQVPWPASPCGQAVGRRHGGDARALHAFLANCSYGGALV